MGEIINLNNIENIICGRENQTVKAAYNIFSVPDDFFSTATVGGEIYNKDTFDWTDGGRYVILTDENFEEIKAQIADSKASIIKNSKNRLIIIFIIPTLLY